MHCADSFVIVAAGFRGFFFEKNRMLLAHWASERDHRNPVLTDNAKETL